ncbi:hypothetical protein SynRCC2555_01337 [Synechococcus sp. WH 8101]|nr:hypothetical protein SynRCC2555_01337 [Synechococcus sp. WH 8101]
MLGGLLTTVMAWRSSWRRWMARVLPTGRSSSDPLVHRHGAELRT